MQLHFEFQFNVSEGIVPSDHNKKKHQVHEARSDCSWRKTRFTTADFLLEMIQRGKKLCPLFSVFGVENTIFRVDWLHSVDHGIGADLIGNVFEMVLGKLDGSTKEARCDQLNAEMVHYYEVNKVQDRLRGFTYNNIRPKMKDPPKLRGCNAATTRCLIPFASELANKYMDDAVPKEAAAKLAAHHLLMVYQSLSGDALYRHEVMEGSSIAFAQQYGALRDASIDPLWRVKPKLHLFLEMCSHPCRPNLFWTYRDEDFGGSLGHQSKMKGCWARTLAFSRHALDLFSIKNPEPRLTCL